MAVNNVRRIIRRQRRRVRGPNPRTFRRMENPLQSLNDREIFVRFRFSLRTIQILVDLLTPFCTHVTNRTMALSVELQLLIALRFFGSGAFYRVIGDTFGVSVATVSRCVDNVTSALCRLAHHYIAVPAGEAASETKRAFYDIAGFPNVLGVVDGTFIKIIAPKDNENDFVNRKGFHSLNVQMMCDHQFRITNCYADWPGSAHDQRILRNSRLGINLENGQYDGIVLGDSAYQCTNYVIPPYLVTDTPSKVRFNKALCKTRVLIEQTYGVLKRRFACLGSCLRVAPQKAAQIVLACSVLHNIGIDHGDIVNFDVDNIGDEGEIEIAINQREGEGGRREYIRETFFP